MAPLGSSIIGLFCSRLIALYKCKQKRFITSLPVEEMFNRVKANVSLGSNTRCTPQRAMAVAVEKGVLSSLNRYEEVDRTHIIAERSSGFSQHADSNGNICGNGVMADN